MSVMINFIKKSEKSHNFNQNIQLKLDILIHIRLVIAREMMVFVAIAPLIVQKLFSHLY